MVLQKTTNPPRIQYNLERVISQSHSTTFSEGLKLKAGQVVKYIDKETRQKYSGKITSQAGKASGKHRNWYNLEYSEQEEIAGSTESVDMGQVSNPEVV